MVLNETVPVAWNSRNKKMYESLGYKYTKMGDYIQVKVEDLPPSSKAVLDVKCDVCGKIMRRRFPDYIKCHSDEYGDTCLDCCQTKRESTNIKVYGNKCTALNPEVKRKQIETQKKNNGGLLYFQTDEFKEKSRESCLERYGVEFPLQNIDILSKVQSTNLNRYGNVCSLHGEEQSLKTKATMIERYGFEYNMQNPEQRIKAMETMCVNGSVPTSKQQIKIFEMLKDKYVDVYINYPVSSLALDVMVKVDDTMIDIEYDGTYWHRNPSRDRKRDEVVKSFGYKILRIESRRRVPTMEELTKAIDYLVKSNHSFNKIIIND